MRHGDKINNLSRTKAHRDALLMNLSISLINHKRIFTTLQKAKELKKYIEPLITRSKDKSMHSRRTCFSYLRNKEAIKELFGVVSDKVGDRPGGYTRILKTGHRAGDNADMCMIELVDFNTLYTKETKAASGKAKTRRSRSKKTDATPASQDTNAGATENNETN